MAETRQVSDEKSRNIKDPAANIIDEYLVDDISDESFLRPDSTRKEEQKTAGQTDKIAQIYKAINQSFERSRVGNTRQFQSENKHYENSKITLQLQNTYTKLNEEQSDKMSKLPLLNLQITPILKLTMHVCSRAMCIRLTILWITKTRI